MAASDHNIIILGGNFAGLSIAHYLLRHTIPALEASSNASQKYKVTLISPSTHLFFKVGAPRLCSPALAPIDKAFLPIADGFKTYPPDRFRFLQGEATDLAQDTKTITVTLTESNEPTTTTTVTYDSLVLATGTTSNSPLWTLHGSHLTSRAAFKDLLLRLPHAHTITIVGGGPAGVETAGELAAQYGRSKSITLLSGTTRLLPRLPPPTSRDAAAYLSAKLGVTVTHNLRLASASALDDATGRTRLALDDGTTRTTDLFIDATGAKPNTSFLPPAWLNANGYVQTDVRTLRATAAGPHVYAVGDVASYSLGSLFDVNNAIAPLASSVLVDLSSSSSSSGMGGGSAAVAKKKQKIHKQSETMTQLVPIGPGGGVGLLFGWRVPSWLVWAAKGRSYFFWMAEGVVRGKDYVKA